MFAERGPWWDGEVNARLLEAALGASRARGSARLLLAAMAALADTDGVLEGVTTEELRQAAGLSNSSYRRARAALLACGDIALVEDGGGRGRSNRWRIPDPRALDRPSASAMSRRAAASDAIPAPVPTEPMSPPEMSRQAEAGVQVTASGADNKPRQSSSRACAPGTGPAPSRVFGGRGPGLSMLRPGSPVKRTPETPPQTPANPDALRARGEGSLEP
ncbi:MAG: hypothetical protein ACLP0J_25320 [Solirubrobacteraceae bacterium]|jgi:hypothetical protein